MLSPQSSHQIYELGIETIPSESECYPAKLAHGHISWLIKRDVPFIFYPCIPYERKEVPESRKPLQLPDGHLLLGEHQEQHGGIKGKNIEVLKSVHGVHKRGRSFQSSFRKSLRRNSIFRNPRRRRPLRRPGMNSRRREPMWRRKAREVLQYLKDTGKHGIVLAGRPYHIDPEINHGIADMITSYGFAVLTEDSYLPFRKGGAPARRYRPVDVPLPPLCGGDLCKDTG